jgi:hypothetical protein
VKIKKEGDMLNPKEEYMRLLYVFHTEIGSFFIGKQEDRFLPIYKDKSFGSYAEAWQAAEDLAGGHTFSIGPGINTATLGIPADLGKWEKLL